LTYKKYKVLFFMGLSLREKNRMALDRTAMQA
jgi:hypothetical protein